MDSLLEVQTRVLDDPESSDEDKAFARKLLGLVDKTIHFVSTRAILSLHTHRGFGGAH